MSALSVNAFLLVVALVTALGNFALKLAADSDSPFLNGWFLLGTLLYAATAIGVVVVLQHASLIGASYIYNMFSLLLVAVVAVTLIGEPMSSRVFWVWCWRWGPSIC